MDDGTSQASPDTLDSESNDSVAVLLHGAAHDLGPHEELAGYSSAAELSGAIFWLADQDGCILTISNAAAAAGPSFQGIIGRSWDCLVHPDDQAEAAASWRQAVAARAPFHAECRLRAADGDHRWVHVRALPRRGADGAPAGWHGMFEDIQERRAAAVAAESEHRFRLMVDGVIDYAIFMLDPAGHVANWNAGAARIKGYTASEVLGSHFSRFYLPEEREAGEPERTLAAAVADGRCEREGWRVRKDGTKFWASVVIDSIRDAEGTLLGFAKITRDITKQRQARQALEEAREQLFQVQKLEAIGQLSGGIAHDFNNLLQGITGSLEVAQWRIAKRRFDDLDHLITGAIASASRAAALTHRLLAFARRQPLDPKPVRVSARVDSMQDMLRRTLGEKIDVVLRFDDAPRNGLWPVLCDPSQLEAAILNLVLNAKEAMPEGGRLTIGTRNVVIDSSAAAKIREAKPGDYVCICVSDTGSGMPQHVIDRAFDPFFTTKPMGQGNGLGLSMTYGFVRQSEGYCKIESEVGKGTSVCLYLPRYKVDADEQPQVVALQAQEEAENGEVVLVVEDEQLVRTLVVEVLSDLGYRALEAGDGPSGLAILQSPQRIDLLVTDIGLPGLNGRQMADAARKTRRDLKILFMTGYSHDAATANGFLEPGMAMMTKPFGMDAMATRIRSMMATC